MDDDQQFCLRWNNHQSTLVSVFDTLLVKEIHVDCTLAAEGRTLKAHKVVLSACSPYFESVLSEQFDKHPIIILKDVKFAELRAMMDYMYRGEVNISQDQLAALLKAAESLQIKGLSDNKPSRPPSRPPPAPAHPPRAPSPPPQTRDGSSDSRSGSLSPSRRRKKARRTSSPVPPAAPAPAASPEPPCKEELARDVEDLTLDDAHTPPADHNDVVRNFQWHMERSQDEIMNSNDSVRENQGRRTTPRHSIMTRSKKVSEETSFATTLAILKNVSAADVAGDDVKENDRRPLGAQTLPATDPAPKAEPEPEPEPKTEPEARYHVFPRGPQQLPCAQYKTDKGYRCPNCQRCYNARKNLVRHVTLECGREPQYKCPHCSYSKHRRNELKKHIEKKHPELAPAATPAALRA
ncbi:longitudinals lacking protein, isoforms F/I/K/T-like isoform X1 [Danaus plexippus]|uniref:longitudinals lacking protein, isoforms F/I/K/T-like isoform X1 n=1 Tax=Danaus plexippus TaxID=13037 RepID=UPI002AAF12B4|nr:longitudinals lacking protein, isoforms F/I/K/T-like isoform X1 [Danaus plexippus]XP_032520464.2 longitudinals lacking protein, isoforms F/I/K/T-like isoform X1 [Danaus plexippus]